MGTRAPPPWRKRIKRIMATKKTNSETARAVLTDVQFWVPAVVLVLGILLLVALH